MTDNYYKKAVLIGASSDSIYAIKLAQEKDIFVCAIDGNPDAVGLKEADLSIVCDISDVQNTEKVIKEINPDFALIVPVGRYLYTTACINDDFNLKGIKKSFTKISVDKYEFHKFLRERNLRNIKSYLLKAFNKNTKMFYDIKFPAIAKPRYGSGSRDVFYFENKQEFDKLLEKVVNLKEDFILEEFVHGEEYGIDAAIINGKFYNILTRKKILTDLPQRQTVAYISLCEKENKIERRITAKMEDVCNAMKYNDCLIQCDIIVNNNDVFVIEISPRPTGHYIYDEFVPFVTGVDMVKEYINYMVYGEDGCCFKPLYTKMAIIKYFDFENMTVSYIPSKEEVQNNIDCKLIKWNCFIKKDDYMDKVTNGHSIMGRGYFILEGESEKSLINDSAKVMSLFN